MIRERSLVLRGQSGDRTAFDELLRLVGRPLLLYIRSLTRPPVSAEDVLQDVLITIVRKLVWLRDPSLFRPWAFRIASRAAFRAMKTRSRTVELEETGGRDIEPPDPWLRQRLAAALPRLTPAAGAVVHLHYIEDMPLSDVAAVLEISLGTVKSRLAYALTQLRRELT